MFSVYYVNRSEKPEFVWRTSIWMSLGCNDTLEVFCKKDVVRNFSKFTSKKIWQSLLLNKVAGLLKKRLWHRCFPVNFTKFLRMPFLIEHLRWLLLLIDGTIPLRNFKFRKRNVPLLTKDAFSQSFQSCIFFFTKG